MIFLKFSYFYVKVYVNALRTLDHSILSVILPPEGSILSEDKLGGILVKNKHRKIYVTVYIFFLFCLCVYVCVLQFLYE
jgi:hypothetical protein